MIEKLKDVPIITNTGEWLFNRKPDDDEIVYKINEIIEHINILEDKER